MKEMSEFNGEPEPEAMWQKSAVSDYEKNLTRFDQMVNLNLNSLRNLINIGYQNTPESVKDAKSLIGVLLATLRNKALLLEKSDKNAKAERLRQKLAEVEKISDGFQGDETTLRNIFLGIWKASMNKE